MADQGQPTDLTALMRALALTGQEARPDGIKVEEIVLVEAACETPDPVVWSHGWALALQDRRRVSLEYTLDGTDTGLEKVKLRRLRPDEPYPALESSARVFWYRPDQTNRLLGLALVTLH